MSRAPWFQTDDIPSGHSTQPMHPTRPTCECSNPETLWKHQGDPWDCTICGNRIRGEARARLKERITCKPPGPAVAPSNRSRSRNPYADRAEADAPKIRACTAFLLDELARWGAFVWNEAATGSKYVKFPHWGLGSITVRNHQVLGKYSYRWVVRVDMPPQGSGPVYSTEELDRLVADFESAAEGRGISPGDRQTWDEFQGRETPAWKARLFDKNQKEVRR